MPTILARIIPFIIEYGGQAIGFLLGLSPKQLLYIIILVAFIGQDLYVYNMGVNHEKGIIEQRNAENDKVRKKIRNTAIDDSVVIDRMLKDKF